MSSLKIKDLGVIYTPKNITTYLCRYTIFPYVLDKVNDHFGTKFQYKGDIENILNQLNKQQLQYLMDVVKTIKILDPAVGTGHFLLEAILTLETIYDYLVMIDICDWDSFQIRKWIIGKNIYGVDLSPLAIDECRTRFSIFLELIKDNDSNVSSKISTNIRCGNSLLGSIESKKKFQKKQFPKLKTFHWNVEFPEITESKGFDLCIGNPPWNIYKPIEKEFFSQYDSRLTKYGVDKKEAKQIIHELLEKEDIRLEWQEYKQSFSITKNYYRKEYKYQSGKILGSNRLKTVSGDINLYKLFLERIYCLLKPQGYCGVIIPSGFHTDAGTKGLRELLFEKNEVRKLYSFENRKGIFHSIHKSFKFDLLIFRKKGKTRLFDAAFMLHDPDIIKEIDSKTISIEWEIIKCLSPSSWSILEFKRFRDVELTQKLYQHPPLRVSIPDSWRVNFFREFDISLDSSLFNTEQKGLTLYEGKMIEQYTHKFKEPRYWILKEHVMSKFGSHYQDFSEYRLGFRAVAASTNRRTMIASIIPRNVCCGNSLIVTKIYDPEGRRLISESDLLYLCGVFNSFVFDYLLRLKVTTNLNMFFIYDMPVPRLSKHDIIYQEIVRNVADLFPKFETLNNQFGTSCSDQSLLNRAYIQATIDSLVAKIYELDKESLEYILDQFHQKDPKKEKALAIQKNAILARFY
ncbi:MAG: Eco57I restriction-modification methylase domain-containing protein [Candidatus Hermodarchaeota archaeon]